MCFPTDYEFTGNQSEQLKEIGNAVAVHVATAFCREALRV
jgi:site-specific DNA-cytosine methylase